ncbi:hypothetical protein K1X84_13125 [bacterium]|nr:hypothetical protein [bacterium]
MANTESLNMPALERVISRLTLLPVLICVMLTTAVLVQIVRTGITTNLLILLFGALLSATSIFSYGVAIFNYVIPKKKSFRASLIIFSGFIPWLFGSYLTFYKGFWSLKSVFMDFQVWLLIKCVIFIISGAMLIRNFYKITQIGTDIDEGRLIILQ